VATPECRPGPRADGMGPWRPPGPGPHPPRFVGALRRLNGALDEARPPLAILPAGTGAGLAAPYPMPPPQDKRPAGVSATHPLPVEQSNTTPPNARPPFQTSTFRGCGPQAPRAPRGRPPGRVTSRQARPPPGWLSAQAAHDVGPPAWLLQKIGEAGGRNGVPAPGQHARARDRTSRQPAFSPRTAPVGSSVRWRAIWGRRA